MQPASSHQWRLCPRRETDTIRFSHVGFSDGRRHTTSLGRTTRRPRRWRQRRRRRQRGEEQPRRARVSVVARALAVRVRIVLTARAPFVCSPPPSRRHSRNRRRYTRCRSPTVRVFPPSSIRAYFHPGCRTKSPGRFRGRKKNASPSP